MPIASKMRTLGDAGLYKYKWCNNLREVEQVDIFFLKDIADTIRYFVGNNIGLLYHNESKLFVCVPNSSAANVQHAISQLFNSNIVVEYQDSSNLIDVLSVELGVLLGEGNFTLTIENDTQTLILHTDRISEVKIQEVTNLIKRVLPMNLDVRHYNHHIEISWRDINRYAACTNIEQLEAVAQSHGLSSYKDDLTTDGEWVYPIPKIQNSRSCLLFHRFSELKKCGNDIVQHFTSAYHLFSYTSLSGEVEYNFPYATESPDLLCKTNVTKAKVSAPNAVDVVELVRETPIEEVTCYCPKAKNVREFAYRCRNLKIANVEFPSATWARQMFYLCQLNKESAIRVMNSLPIYAGSRGNDTVMGIHVDHQNDEEVLAAIANLGAKGWVVTVQWNGNPTSGISTLDLEGIYAKPVEFEYGEYTDGNGTRCTLDWGHMITSPDGKTPSELGYKLFFSIVEAETYYNLTKIEVIENE